MFTIKNKKSLTKLNQLYIIAGSAIVALACLSSVFYAYTNQRFIIEIFPSLIYYMNYAVVLGGGYIAGYFVTKSKKSDRQAKLLSAVGYAFLAGSLYGIYDLLRVFIQNIIGDFGYPIGMYVFQTAPLIVLFITAGIAYALQFRKNVYGFSQKSQILLISSFILYELMLMIQMASIYVLRSELPTTIETPVMIMLAEFILQPLVVALVSYVALSNIKQRLNRLFYAAMTGSFSMLLIQALWNFRVDASHNSTLIFQGFVYVITIIATFLLILKTRTVSKH